MFSKNRAIVIVSALVLLIMPLNFYVYETSC